VEGHVDISRERRWSSRAVRPEEEEEEEEEEELLSDDDE